MLEGSLYTANPETRAINAGFCSLFDGLLAAGVFYDGQNTPGFKLLSHEDYGHVDHVFSIKHTQEVEHPILSWLMRDVK